MKYQNPNIESSYQKNDLGKTLYDFVLEHKPKKIIEFGALYGYSTVAMAMALDEIGEGEIIVYDLFEDYSWTHSAHKHTDTALAFRKGWKYYVDMIKKDYREWFRKKHDITQKEVENHIAQYGLSKYVTIKKGDFMDWIKKPEDFDLLHVDISNNGDVIKLLSEKIQEQKNKGGIVLFEGGSYERDSIEWMNRYNKTKMNESGVKYKVLNEKFPSLSKLI
ncbi:MAG: O-methyltransferase [Minisyncoccota bacterium]